MLCQILMIAALAAQSNGNSLELTPLSKSRALLGMIQEGDAKAFEWAKQAYEASLEADSGIEFKNYPLAFWLLGPAEETQALAWRAYEKHRNPKVDPPVPFPVRPKSSPARCEHVVVDEAEVYLKIALEAGADTFATATTGLRSPVEISSALALLPSWPDPRAVSIGLDLVQRLRRATASKREFTAAKDLRTQLRRFAAFAPTAAEEIEEAWQYYETRNQNLPACDPPQPSELATLDFAELKHRVLRGGETASSEFEFMECLMRLYAIADQDPARMRELESTGNSRVSASLQVLRAAMKARQKLSDETRKP